MFIKDNFVKEKAEKNEEIGIGEWGMHGDVIIKRVDKLPDNFSSLAKEPMDCLAYGESTGHAHKLFDGEFDLRIDPDKPTHRHLRVVKPVSLRHQEHKEITLREGDYYIHIQTQYDPWTKKIEEVVD